MKLKILKAEGDQVTFTKGLDNYYEAKAGMVSQVFRAFRECRQFAREYEAVVKMIFNEHGYLIYANTTNEQFNRMFYKRNGN